MKFMQPHQQCIDNKVAFIHIPRVNNMTPEKSTILNIPRPQISISMQIANYIYASNFFHIKICLEKQKTMKLRMKAKGRQNERKFKKERKSTQQLMQYQIKNTSYSLITTSFPFLRPTLFTWPWSPPSWLAYHHSFLP